MIDTEIDLNIQSLLPALFITKVLKSVQLYFNLALETESCSQRTHSDH